MATSEGTKSFAFRIVYSVKKKCFLDPCLYVLRTCATFRESILLLKLCGNCAFPQNSNTKKICEVFVFYTVMVSLFWPKRTQTTAIHYPLLDSPNAYF